MSDKSRAERNAARDAEIRRLHAEGRSNGYLADHFEVSESRISQIIHGRDRANERKGACMDPVKEIHAMREIVLGRPPTGVRPRIKLVRTDLYECSDGVVTRAARTKEGTYHRWLTAAIKHELEQRRRVVPSSPLGAPQPAGARRIDAFTAPAEVKPVRRAPNGRGKPMEAVKPPPAPNVDLSQPVEPHAGPVTVLPGTRQFAPLKLSTTLRQNGARAAQVYDKPLISIAGSTVREDAA